MRCDDQKVWFGQIGLNDQLRAAVSRPIIKGMTNLVFIGTIPKAYRSPNNVVTRPASAVIWQIHLAILAITS